MRIFGSLSSSVCRSDWAVRVSVSGLHEIQTDRKEYMRSKLQIFFIRVISFH